MRGYRTIGGWNTLGATSLLVTVGLGAVAQAEPRYHDGLYVRASAGLSYFSDSVESDPLPIGGTAKGTLAGTALTGQIAVGGSIQPGFVLGGGLLLHHVPSPSASDPTFGAIHLGQDLNFQPSTLLLIGPYVDYYIAPASGLHFQGSIGYGHLSLGEGRGSTNGIVFVPEQSGGGLAAMLGGGYDWWVSDAWSLGVLGQLTFGIGSGDDSTGLNWTHHVLVPSLLFSAAMN